MQVATQPAQDPVMPHEWADCRFLSCSVLPVRVACNLRCPFCFSKSSISALAHDRCDWHSFDLASYYAFAKARGAHRLVITGGGEPLLRPQDVLHMIQVGRRYFDEITCFSNGTFLTHALARQLQEAGLSYLCYSRHSEDDERCRALMGEGAPTLDDFFAAADTLPIRATCVMTQGTVDSTETVWRYIDKLAAYGVTEFTFKHTYTTYTHSVFRGSDEDRWAANHQVEFDPFAGQGEIIATLPWGPSIRRIRGLQLCYYHEPTPHWERQHQLCRSSNLLSNGKVYASLEDQRSLLYQLNAS